MFTIKIYRRGKTWLFDDTARQIKAEPFVCGASELIQKYLDKKGLSRRRKNIPVVFSTQPFADAECVLTCTEKCYPIKWEKLSNIFGKHLTNHFSNVVRLDYDKSKKPTSAHYIDQEGQKCWLCPAQLKFFGQVADTIYAKFG